MITTGELYQEYLHGIAETKVDENLNAASVVNWEMLGRREDFESGRKERGTRVSLTFRDVLKVKRMGKGLGFLAKRPS